MSLSSLSNEILTKIVEDVHEHRYIDCRSQENLCSLAVCSRHLNAIATPILYQDCNQQEFLNFFLTTLENEELRRHVKAISIDSQNYYYKVGEDFQTYGRVIADSDHFSQTHRRRWIRDLGKGDMDAIAALALLVYPELTMLSLRGTFGSEYYINAVLSVATGEEKRTEWPLHKLKAFRRTSDLWEYTHAAELLPQMANLGEQLSSLSSTRNITSLELGHGIFQEGVLEFLPSFHNLQELHVVKSMSDQSDPRYEAYAQAISHLRPVLKKLTIGAKGLPYHEFDVPSFLGSLVEFTSLCHIEVSAGMLFDPATYDSDLRRESGYFGLLDILPSSLEVLRIDYMFDWDLLWQVYQLLDKKHEVTPRLRELRLDLADLTNAASEDLEFGEWPYGLVHPRVSRSDIDQLNQIQARAKEVDVEVYLRDDKSWSETIEIMTEAWPRDEYCE